jgi:FlaA1/EpsC-like NDP-sugar epimerase
MIGTMLLDLSVVWVSTVLAYAARFEGAIPSEFEQVIVPAAIGSSLMFVSVFLISGLYGYLWRYIGTETLVRLALMTCVATSLIALIDTVIARQPLGRPVPLGVLLNMAVFSFIGFGLVRYFMRITVYRETSGAPGMARRVLVVGAGDAAALLVRDLENQHSPRNEVVGFLDDDPLKAGRRLSKAQVLGTTDRLPELAARHHVDEVLVAIPSATADQVRRIMHLCGQASLPTRVVPALAKQTRSVRFANLETVDLENLLGREIVRSESQEIRHSIEGRIVLVTGAAGSIGSELCRQIAELDPAELVMLETDESRLYMTYLEVEQLAPGKASVALCDIRDADKLRSVFERHRPQLVVHAAAYKHVPLLELEPDEAVKTNVLGTRNVLDACREFNAERFLLISTDKAVQPTSVMGATKAIAERLTFDAAHAGLRATAVRFGNVLGSRGSLVPIVVQRLDNADPVSITHPEMDRFFMTIPEAVQLVLQSQAISDGGELFVLDMGGPVRILDLVGGLIQLQGGQASMEFSGARPAEKLHETLVGSDETLLPTERPKVLRCSAVPLAGARFAEDVSELIRAAEEQRRAIMPSLFRRLCPEFSGDGSNVPRTRS